MINLLPPNRKRDIKAGRSNTLLVRYNALLFCTVAFLFLAVSVVYFYLNTAKVNAERTIEENRAKVANFSVIEQQAEVFRKNLATAKQILDHETTYTKVMLEIAKLLPSGVVLSTLNLDAPTFGTPTTLTAQAKTYNQALALKDAFSGSLLFSNVHFESITTSDSAGTQYPLTVNLSVTFRKEAAKQ